MKLIFLTSRFPYPINKGDKLRAYYQIKELAKTNEIHLIALTEKKIDQKAYSKLKNHCKSITVIKLSPIIIITNLLKTFINNKPFQVNYFYTSKIQKKIDSIINELNPDHIYCQLIRTALYMKDQYKFTSTLDYMDALSLGIKRRIKISNILFKPILKIEYERLVKFENLAFEFFNNHTIISKIDRENIKHPKNKEIKIITNGIDNKWLLKKKYPKEYDLVFIGNLSYVPNIEASLYIIKKIVPLLISYYPNLKVLIAGSNPSKKIIKLSNRNIDVVGWIDDIKGAYCKGKVFFAPMTIGSGLQNKLLEAMSLEIPCVTSKLANRSLNATHNENILVGNNTKEYIAHIRKCLDNEKFRKNIGEKGKEYILANFNWQDANNKLLKIFHNQQNFKNHNIV